MLAIVILLAILFLLFLYFLMCKLAQISRKESIILLCFLISIGLIGSYLLIDNYLIIETKRSMWAIKGIIRGIVYSFSSALAGFIFFCYLKKQKII